MLIIAYIFHQKIKTVLIFFAKGEKEYSSYLGEPKIPILNTAQKPERYLR